jgi:hypothetical protein
MDNSLDETTLATISLLESRLIRLEHLLYGQTSLSSPVQDVNATLKLGELERRFQALTSHIRVYGELLKICTCYSDPPCKLLLAKTHSRQSKPRLLPLPAGFRTTLTAID